MKGEDRCWVYVGGCLDALGRMRGRGGENRLLRGRIGVGDRCGF